MIFSDSKKFESTYYPLNWAVDYLDETYLTEYDLTTQKKNDFYSIQSHKVNRFGLFGLGMKFYYSQDGGLTLNGRRIDIEYHTEDKIYGLTNSFAKKDCISYKQAYTDYNNIEGVQQSNLESINFGYKTLIDKDEIQLFFQPIVAIPMEGKVYIDIKLTSNKDLKGKLIFKHRNNIIDEYDAPLTKNYSGNIKWEIK